MRQIALTAATILAVGTALAVGPSKLVHASGPCYYQETTFTDYGAVPLPNGNYINETLELWQVPASGCTQWAAHDYGDTEFEVMANLGSTANHFILNGSAQPNVFGWDAVLEGDTFPEATFKNVYNAPSFDTPATWTQSVTGTIQPLAWGNGNGTLGGTDGNTEIYLSTTYEGGADGCAFAGPDGLDGFGVALGYDSYVTSQVDVSGYGVINLQNIAHVFPGNSGNC